MIIINQHINRYQIINKLKKNNCIGIELGVAEGFFSEKMLVSNKFINFYGVDSYSEFQHNENEYLNTKKKLKKFKNFELIRDTFENSVNLFNDNYFDFIYIDGFAHTGNNAGKTIYDWFSKLKVGGILAGDDYHKDWPLVIKTVNEFINQTNFNLNLTSSIADNPYSQYPSWYIIKSKELKLKNFNKFINKAKIEHQKEKFKRKFMIDKYKSFLYKILISIVGKRIFNLINNMRKKYFNFQ
jgi:hypothetical protein